MQVNTILVYSVYMLEKVKQQRVMGGFIFSTKCDLAAYQH